MRLTKYTHSCVRIDQDGRSVVVDPGVFSETDQALAEADEVLITHAHPDHLDTDAVIRTAAARPELRLWGPESVRHQLGPLDDRFTVVAPGEEFEAAGLKVRVFGGQHALIHTDVPVVANLAYLIEDSVYHPGDSFVVPATPVETLLLPIHAPWSKVGEVLDFLTSVRAPRIHQIHEGLLNQRGLNLVEGHVRRVAHRYGCAYEHLDSPTSVDL